MGKLMLSLIVVASTALVAFVNAADPFEGPIGWADVASDAGTGTMVKSTTGGTGGRVVIVDNSATLTSEISKRKSDKTPVILQIKGTLTYTSEMHNVNDCSNMTIEGFDKNAKISGFGFYIRKSSNIIFRNLTFENCPDDAINIDGSQTPVNHHIWVDHCNFSDLPMGTAPSVVAATSDAANDGLLDIKNGSCYITVSFCRFDNHSKAMLFGHECNVAADANIKVTVHHNWFGFVAQRATRNRTGKVHLFNNFYDNTGTVLFPTLEKDKTYHHGYAIASVCGANVVVENNYFKNVQWATLVSRNSETSAEWKSLYGLIGTLPHWCPTSDEDPGYLSYRGDNIQNPPAGTEIDITGPGSITQKYKILPFDKSNLDPNNWNPWTDYGYSAEKIATVLHDAKDVPDFVQKSILGNVAVTNPAKKIISAARNVRSSDIYYNLNGKLIGYSSGKISHNPAVCIVKGINGIKTVIAK